jgi:hypothetical protein
MEHLAYLDRHHEITETAIGFARLHLTQGQPGKALTALDRACAALAEIDEARRGRVEVASTQEVQTDDAGLSRILRLAHAAFRAERSRLWKSDMGAALAAHGEACEALWDELERQLTARNAITDPAIRRLKR